MIILVAKIDGVFPDSIVMTSKSQGHSTLFMKWIQA